MTIQQRAMRIVTAIVVRHPGLWRLLRRPVAANFDALAASWDASRVDARRLAVMGAVLDAVVAPPARVLDLGTGSGAVARLVAERWPEAEVTGADLSAEMVAEAQRLATSARERYEVADAAALPYADGSFELVTLNNMIPFFDELARVVAPGGAVAVAFGLGAQTPIYVPLDRVARELARRGLTESRRFEVEPGIALLARKP